MSAPAVETPVPPITVRVPEAVRLLGLSRSRIYELIRDGEIEFIKVGATTLLPYDGLRRFVDRRRPVQFGDAPEVEGDSEVRVQVPARTR